MRDVDNDDDLSASHDADEHQLHHSANHPPAGMYRIYGRESTKKSFFHSLHKSCTLHLAPLDPLFLLLHLLVVWPFARVSSNPSPAHPRALSRSFQSRLRHKSVS